MSSERYVEIVLKGSEDQAMGFVEGLRIATPEVERVWYCCQHPLEFASLMDSIKEKLHLSTRVVLPKKLAEMVAGALAETEVLEIEVASMAEVDYAELPFDFRAYSREVGESLKRLIEEQLPGGVRIDGYELKEEVDEDARGIELYSPAHDYTLHGEGVYVGPIPEIFEMASRLADQEFVHTAKIRLHHVS